MENPNQGTWHAFKLTGAEDEALSVDFTQFKEMFVAHLEEVVKHVSVRIKKPEDGAVWIRIAWGDNFTKPNHFKPTYAVHYLQTPYVFILNLTAKHKPYLYQVTSFYLFIYFGHIFMSFYYYYYYYYYFYICLYESDCFYRSHSQALVLSTRYVSINEAHLTGRSLAAMRDLLMKQYQQVFPNQERTLKERNALPSHPNIDREHAEFAEGKHQMACEAFGDGTVPKLETAVYKLETRYRGSSNNTLSDRDELFRGVVKFSSPSLLESLRHCASTGMSEGPVTPLLSSITQKGRNLFVIAEKVPGSTSRTPARKT
ncbi:centromere protein N isoform X3 [Ictalurus punctatus]|nr:centromere protein N isoform X3 [Ictalurus punctatus]